MIESKRLVQVTGGSSFSVTIPKGWARQQGVREGTMLIMRTMEDGGLIIYPEGRQPSRSFTEIVIESGPNVGRDIVGAYLYGYDTIQIRSRGSFNEEELAEVKKAVRGLAGAEIVEEAPNKIEVQVMLDPEAVTPEKVLRRQYALVLGMVDDAAKSLINKDPSLARTVVQRDEEVDRHYFTLVRVIRSAIREPELGRRMRQTPLTLLDLRVAAKFLEDSGDQAATMARETAKHDALQVKNELSEALSSLSDVILQIGSEPIEALLSHNSELTLHTLALRSEFLKRSGVFLRLVSQATPPMQLYLLRAFACLDRICENFADIAELGAPIISKAYPYR